MFSISFQLKCIPFSAGQVREEKDLTGVKEN